MEASMNTLYILDDPGRDRHFHDYALAGLESAGFTPLTVYFTGDTSVSTIGAAGHDVLSFGLPVSLYKNFNPFPILKILKLVKAGNAQLIHVQRHRALIYAGIACRIAGIPLIYTIRSTQLIRNANRRFAFRLIAPTVSRIIAVSHGVRADYLARTGYPPEKIVVISNGIDITPYNISTDSAAARIKLQLPEKGIIFGMAARFKKAKDHLGLIEAFASVIDEMPDAWLVLAGDGPRESLIRQAVIKHAVEKRVIFTGRLSTDEIPVFLKALDVFIHPSFREGMPAAILEAMAAGLPIIATDAEGVPDIFDTPLDLGVMVPRGDTKALARAMTDLFNMPRSERAVLGRNASKRLEDGFTHSEMAESIVNVYREVIEEHGNRY